jgi:hypothetical protein
VYLCVAGHGGLCRRDTVLGVFWPEFDQEHAGRRCVRRCTSCDTNSAMTESSGEVTTR